MKLVEAVKPKMPVNRLYTGCRLDPRAVFLGNKITRVTLDFLNSSHCCIFVFSHQQYVPKKQKSSRIERNFV